MGTSKPIDSSAASLFEVPGSNSPLVAQELQIGGTSVPSPKFVSRARPLSLEKPVLRNGHGHFARLRGDEIGQRVHGAINETRDDGERGQEAEQAGHSIEVPN